MRTSVTKSISMEILKAIGTGLALFFILSSPSGTKRIIRGVRKEWKNRNIPRILDGLYRKRLVDFRSQKDGSLLIEITDRGRKELRIYQLGEIMFEKKKSDGYWRIIFFDIPERQKIAREALRRKLVEWGLYPIQRSVYVSLYPCEEEVYILSEMFGLKESCIFVVKTREIPGGEKIRKHFNSGRKI